MWQSLFAWTGNLIQWQEIFICTYQIWFLLQYNRKWKSQGIQSCKDWRKPWLTYFSTSWNFNYFKLWKEVNERVLGKKNVRQFSFNKKKYENLTLRRERERELWRGVNMYPWFILIFLLLRFFKTINLVFTHFISLSNNIDPWLITRRQWAHKSEHLWSMTTYKNENMINLEDRGRVKA